MNERSPLSRRRFLATTSLAATAAASALWLDPRSLFAQDPAVPDMVVKIRAQVANAKIRTQSLRGNVSALLGSGGNIAVLPGKDGKVIVDSGFASSRPHITEALDALSADPVSHLINTHWHFDHTDGNEWMHGAGATILAHENTKIRLSTAQTVTAWEVTFPPSPAGAIPTETLADKKTLHLNGATIELVHYDPSHTDTDISIYFTEADVLHAGDTWWNGFYPFIDYSTGGNINGMIRATERTLADATAKTLIIPGHGPIGDKIQLIAYRDVLVSARDSVAALKKQGKTLQEVIAAKPTAAYDAKWGDSTDFLGYVYQGV
jgi:glyoxylase-like metal-dependent hydrolase (beta-lactamase superfamily II)